MSKSIKPKENSPEKILDVPVPEQLDVDSNGDQPQEEEFVPMGPDYVIRQQQLANFQMLCQFFVHREKNLANILDDIRVSLDCLTKSVLQTNKNLEKLCSVMAPQSAPMNGTRGAPPL